MQPMSRCDPEEDTREHQTNDLPRRVCPRDRDTRRSEFCGPDAAGRRATAERTHCAPVRTLEPGSDIREFVRFAERRTSSVDCAEAARNNGSNADIDRGSTG